MGFLDRWLDISILGRPISFIVIVLSLQYAVVRINDLIARSIFDALECLLE